MEFIPGYCCALFNGDQEGIFCAGHKLANGWFQGFLPSLLCASKGFRKQVTVYFVAHKGRAAWENQVKKNKRLGRQGLEHGLSRSLADASQIEANVSFSDHI